MPIRRPLPDGRVRSTSGSPGRPILLEHQTFPSSYHGHLDVPFHRASSSLSSSASSLSTNSLLQKGGLVGRHAPFLAARRGPFETPSQSSSSLALSFSPMHSQHPDPSFNHCNVEPGIAEPDDWLHDPNCDVDDNGTIFTLRGLANLGCVLLIALILLTASAGGTVLAVLSEISSKSYRGPSSSGINATGQIFEIPPFALVDKDTPPNARTRASPVDGRKMQLVFSDEFEQEDRTFWPGDDPFWEAEDLYYWGTNDLEWYDPQQVYTKGGKLVLELKGKAPEINHGKLYVGGFLTSWNKLCFTGGLIEASVQLPGSPEISGLWPAIWTMGNLGKAGYGATTEGLWPYSYEACDIGAVPNQTENGFPDALGLQMGDKYADYHMSFQPGQRLSSCTCPGESHPGPIRSDGTFTARSSPEIDMFEVQIDSQIGGGAVSQSAQFAPFNGYYRWDNATYAQYYQPTGEQHINGYGGGVYQQAGSVVSKTNQACYQLPGSGVEPCYSTFGFQYKPGFASDGGHVTWINDGSLSWRLDIAGFGDDVNTGISSRMVSKEPMYIIMNLGMSEGFSGAIDFSKLTLPAYLQVDWIRIYQYEDEINIGCSPPGYPTSEYIDAHSEAYTNPNLTTWTRSREEGGYQQPWPKNSRISGCGL